MRTRDSESRRAWVGRLSAEFVVIVLGVLIALAADRWMSGFDRKDQESLYLFQLADNLRADSTALARQMEVLSERSETALQLLLLTEASDTTRVPDDARSFGIRFETVGFYDPMDYADETWRDLVSTGNVGVIGDPGLRQALSRYYNQIEAFRVIETEWNAQLRVYETNAWNVLPPLRRLSVLSAGLEELYGYPILGDVEVEPPSHSDVLVILDGIRSRPDLRAQIGQVRMTTAIAGVFYRDVQSEATTLLRLVEQAR